jgi:hypothetical protein
MNAPKHAVLQLSVSWFYERNDYDYKRDTIELLKWEMFNTPILFKLRERTVLIYRFV